MGASCPTTSDVKHVRGIVSMRGGGTHTSATTNFFILVSEGHTWMESLPPLAGAEGIEVAEYNQSRKRWTARSP